MARKWTEKTKLKILATTDAADSIAEIAEILAAEGVPRTTWLYWKKRRAEGYTSAKPGRPPELDRRIKKALEPIKAKLAKLEKKIGE